MTRRTGRKEIFVRQRGPAAVTSAAFGPKRPDHPSVGQPCPACGQALRAGDLTVLVPLWPGSNPEARARAREQRWYAGLAAELHLACATGRGERQ